MLVSTLYLKIRLNQHLKRETIRMISLRTVLVLCFASMAAAQIPSLGWCPEYAPMADFDMNRYLGVWHEAERYFSLIEAGSRCVTTNYTQALDGKFHVSNQITNRLTGIKRILDGELRSVGKAGEGKLTVKYTTLPVSFDTTFSVLDTDYDSYSVLWSCSGLGPAPFYSQNAWVMTRERLAPGVVMQRAYGVLDKYKISRAFFVKTDQADCKIIEASNSHDDTVAPVVDAEEESALRGANVPVAVHVAQVVDPKLVVKQDEPVADVLKTPSESMLPPVPIKAADVVKSEVEKVPFVDEKVEAEVAPVKVAEPVVDAIKAEPAVEKVEPIVPQLPAKVLAAKSHLRKKTNQS